MNETKITFHNKIQIKVQAQIFTGNDLINSCVVEPGESCSVTGKPGRFDIYFKNGRTGWKLAYKLDCDAKNFTLCGHRGGYFIA